MSEFDLTMTSSFFFSIRHGGQLTEFVEGLGPAQMVGRQVLGSPCMGQIQLGLAKHGNHLEVEVIRARALMSKPGAKQLPCKH